MRLSNNLATHPVRDRADDFRQPARARPAVARRVVLELPVAELSDSQRAVLQMLAASTRGYSLSTLRARGFAFEMLQGLVRTGLASTNRDVVGEDGTKVPHLRISEAGRRALAE